MASVAANISLASFLRFGNSLATKKGAGMSNPFTMRVIDSVTVHSDRLWSANETSW